MCISVLFPEPDGPMMARPGPAHLRHHDAVARQPPGGRLRRRDGRPRVLAAGQQHLWLRPAKMNLPFDTSDEVAEVAQSMLRPFPLAEFSHLTEMIVEHPMKPGYDHGDEFEYGLD